VRDAPNRERRSEEGFTLIELMVVVLIIAILLAIAVPTFLGARERAQNTGARADLRNAMVAAQVHYSETEDYRLLTPAILKSIEVSLDYDDNIDNADYDTVGFTDAGPRQLVMVRQSRSGDYFCMAVGTGATQTGRADTVAAIDSVVECTGGWD
jgi:type IV pilus assembly protein PilA